MPGIIRRVSRFLRRIARQVLFIGKEKRYKMEYIHLFDTVSHFEDQYDGNGYQEPWVSYTIENDEIDYNKKNYREMPLTFEITSPGIVMWKASRAMSSAYKTIYYSLNGGDWIPITSSTGGVSFNVTTGDIVRFKGTNNSYGAFSQYGYGARFNGTTAGFIVEGNIMSLINADNFQTMDALTAGTYNFYQIFYGCSGLTSAKNLILPATSLTNNCYSCMFQACTALTSSPKLPASTLKSNCYYAILSGTSALPDCTNIHFDDAATVQSLGLAGLFDGTKVTDNDLYRILPKNGNDDYCLPVTALTGRCYYAMFSGCHFLTKAPKLPAQSLASECYRDMFRDCISLVTPPELPATTLAGQCYDGMFSSCTTLTQAPDLPAQTLISSCYRNMFSNASSLNRIKCLATDVSASSCLSNWVSGVAGTGTFIKAQGMTSWPSGASGIPDGWTVTEVQ